jgi:Mu transposase, C-terminal domain
VGSRHVSSAEKLIWDPIRGLHQGQRSRAPDNNKYSVLASAVGRPVEIRAYADRIELRQDGRIVGEHRRVFGRGQTVYDPWHYVPVLARKPGALRNGAPFKAWLLPAALEQVRRKLAKAPGGDRQMVDILTF